MRSNQHMHQSHIDTRCRLLWHSTGAFTACYYCCYCFCLCYCFVQGICLFVCLTFLLNKLSLWVIFCQYYSFFECNWGYYYFYSFFFLNSMRNFDIWTSIAHHSFKTDVQCQKIKLAEKRNKQIWTHSFVMSVRSEYWMQLRVYI